MTEEKLFPDKTTLDYLFSKLHILINESDRGTVLLGLSQIDNELQLLLDAIAPKEMSRKDKKWIDRATLASKLNLSYTCRLIPKHLYDSINILRHIRNDIAHKVYFFNLENHTTEIEKVYTMIGENTSTFIHDISLYTLLNNAIEIAMTVKHPNDNKPLFSNFNEAFNYLKNNKEIREKIEEPLLRTKLSMSILIICGLIIYHRKKSLQVLSDKKIISSL